MLLTREHTIYFSQISTLEITSKFSIGKMQLLSSPVECISSRVRLFGVNYVSLKDEVFFKVCGLPRHHGNPFDGLIMPQH